MSTRTATTAKRQENFEFIPIYTHFLNYNIKVEEEYNYPYLYNQTIFINADYFYEINQSNLEYWTIEMYEQQWREGLERLKTQDSSCVVNSIPNPQRPDDTVNIWVLYKLSHNIHIQNHYLSYDTYGNKTITPKNCYNFFIKPRKVFSASGMKISEWVVPIIKISLESIDSLEAIQQIVAKQEFDEDIAQQLTKELTTALGL